MHKVFVTPHVEMVSIRYLARKGKGHVMGSCSLDSVTARPDGIEGSLIEEWSECRELSADVLRHFVRIFPTETGWATFNGGETESVTGKTFKAAYVCGPEFYVSR